MAEAAPGRPEATVVVTNHDYARFLPTAVDSALAQEGVRLQVVVVDDGSTDGSADVLDGYGSRVVAVRQPNLGQGAAINAGFARATGETVLFLDADDVLEPDVVARCVEALAGDPGCVRVQFVLRCIDADDHPLEGSVPARPERLPRGDVRAAVLSHPDDLPWQPTSGNAFRASALARLLPMPTEAYRISADHYLSNLTPLLGTVAVLDRPGGSYRVHGANRDYRATLDLARTREIIVRTIATHEHLDRLARSLGAGSLPDPLAVRSVSFFANRLASLRLDPAHHPVAGDRRLPLVLGGVRAAAGRLDLSPVGRLAAMAWFALAGIAPRPLCRWLADRALGPATGCRPGTGG